MTKRTLRFIALAVVLVGVLRPDTAFAQRASPEVPQPTRHQVVSLSELDSFIRCLVQRDQAAAQGYLAARNDDAAAAAHYNRLVLRGSSSCLLASRARFATSSLRGAFAELLYESSNAPVPSDVQTPATAGGAPAPARPLWTTSTPRDRGAAGEAAARCFVRTHPGRAHQLLQLAAGSREEIAVFRDIAPSLAECLPAGEPAILNSILLRASIAEALYWQVLGGRSAAGTDF